MGCNDHFRLAVMCDLGPARPGCWMRHLIGQRVVARHVGGSLQPDVGSTLWSLRQNVVRDSRHRTEIDGPVLAVAVAQLLGGERAERHLELVRGVRDAALGAGTGALGLADVLVALNDARVEHLIYDPQVRYVGAVGADDVLLASPHAGGLLVEESRLTERIVERCLRTAARITPLDAIAAATLADAGGIAALLRW
jgi:hypothetical protein